MTDLDRSAEASVFELPSLGADMDYGSVLEWRVAPGDVVSRGDVVALVATEKADIDVEIWQGGTVDELLVEVGQEVPVGTPLIRLRGASASVPEASKPVVNAPASATPPISPIPTIERTGVLASPLARSIARERQIDLRRVTGTGPDGAVLARDLDAAPVRSAAVDRSAGMRRAIADRMAKANRDIPHYHLEIDVDMGPALSWLEAHNQSKSLRERVLPAALLLRATARAAARHHECNGIWTTDGFSPSDTVDLGVAISLRSGGLVTPVIAKADERSLDDTMAALQERVAGARTGSLRSSWMVDASITVTNLGDNGADRVNGVIFPPQVALVGFGRIRERPWVVGQAVVPRPMITVSFAGDHRATDGAAGSRFLATIASYLAAPEES